MHQKKYITKLFKNLRNDSTLPEILLWNVLKNLQFYNIKFRRQATKGDYIYDFLSFNPKIAIEIDGEQHAKEDIKKKDSEKQKFLENKGFIVIHIWNGEILQNMDGVLRYLEEELGLVSN